MVASASLTLAAIHGFVWYRQRSALASLMFCLMATATAGMAACELWMMSVQSPHEYNHALQCFNILRWMITLSMVGFVHYYLGTGRMWLALSVCGVRTLGLLLNFTLTPNIYYSSISELRKIMFLGKSVTIVEGTPNPLMFVGQFSLILLAVYLVDATVRGHRLGIHRSLIVGTSMLVFVMALSVQTFLVLWESMDTPITTSIFFMGIIATMGLELSNDMVRAAILANNLQNREYELHRERQLTDAIFESAPGMLYLHAREGQIVRWNSQHEKITGYSNEETKLMKAEDLFLPEDLPKLNRSWDRAFSKGSDEVVVDLIRKDGQAIRHLFTMVRVEVRGKPHLVGIGVDLSSQRALAIESAHHNEEMAQLAQMASMSELSSSIAHELNQPLTIILSNAQAAQRLLTHEKPDIKELQEILDDIVSADIRAADVIKKLRTILSRGEPTLELVDPMDLFDNAISLAQADVDASGVFISKKITSNLPQLYADRIPVEQVLLNLIKNACDAMEGTAPPSRHLSLSCKKDSGFIQFSVQDNGCGLPEDFGRIFDAFHSTKPSGLGLGLAISRTIIRAHGGQLWAEPAKDRGAIFHFTLPLDASNS
ncbi:MAG: PAS domain-containing sensor histidine kinase [Spartobacteria bacterium]|jgi:PAS domain S-box-containing protein|nr:PAS domain-containing sensor histidine kinase [Spartobacteria bacterium]